MAKYLSIILLCIIHCTILYAQSNLRVVLNKGSKMTNDPRVELVFVHPHVHDKSHSEMRIGYKSDLSDTEWEPYKKSFTYKLKDQEGLQTIYAQLKNAEDELSPVVTTSIILDKTPPINRGLVIKNGDKYNNRTDGKVKLDIKADGATEMQVSNEPSFKHHTQWEEYAPQKIWELDARGDGVKWVYTRFRDDAGNLSAVDSASIVHDTKAPDGTILINNGDIYTTSQLVYLTINSEEEDVAEIRVVGPRAQVFPYQRGSAGKGNNAMLQVWWLDSIQGKKIVKVWFKDFAGNISSHPAVDDIFLDLDHPDKPLISINQGEEYCTDANGFVNLKIGTTDDHTGYSMMISNDPNFTDAQKVGFMAVYPNWQLESSEDGKKTVYLKMFNEAGSGSEVAEDDIILYRTKPKPVAVMINDGTQWTNEKEVKISASAENASMIQVSNNPNFTTVSDWRSLEDHLRWSIIGNEGLNRIYVRFEDKAGNITETITGEINFDSKAPQGTVTINGGSSSTSNTLVELNISYDDDAVEMMLSNDLEFGGASWQNVQPALEWVLVENAGPKTVYYRFKDRAGNLSEPKRAFIELIAKN